MRYSIWSTGRGSVRRSDPGLTQAISWTPLSQRSSTDCTRRSRPLDLAEDPGTVCLLASGAARRGRALSRSKLPYHPLCTTRGRCPLNINSHSDSVSHHSSYLGLIVSPHLHLIHTHTYKQHTSMHSLRSLDLPRLSLLSVTTRVCFSGYYLCLDPRLCDSSLVALTRTVSLDSDISRLP